jgi:hypothetical protein
LVEEVMGMLGDLARIGLATMVVVAAEGNLSPRARKRARGAFEFCDFAVATGVASSLRRCLQKQHDRFIDFINSEYWEAVKTGS